MLNASPFSRKEQKHPLSLVFFTLTVLMLSATPYFFLEFQEKKLVYKSNPVKQQTLRFSLENEPIRDLALPKVKGLRVYRKKIRSELEDSYNYFACIGQDFQNIDFSSAIYLEQRQGEYHFAKTPSELAISFKKKSDQIQVYQKLIDDRFHLEKDYLLPIETHQDPQLFLEDPFQILQKGEFLGLDKVSSFLGRDRYRFKIGDEVLLIERGNLLFFDKNKWVISDTMDGISDKLIVKITDLDPDLKIDCFDFSGRWAEKKYPLVFPAVKGRSSLSKIEDVKMRSATKVSLCIEKQKVFLEEKGWAIKKEGKWKMVSSEVVLQEKAEAVFYLESIQNKEIIVHWMDPIENTSEKLSVAFSHGSLSKKNHRKSLQRRGVQ